MSCIHGAPGTGEKTHIAGRGFLGAEAIYRARRRPTEGVWPGLAGLASGSVRRDGRKCGIDNGKCPPPPLMLSWTTEGRAWFYVKCRAPPGLPSFLRETRLRSRPRHNPRDRAAQAAWKEGWLAGLGRSILLHSLSHSSTHSFVHSFIPLVALPTGVPKRASTYGEEGSPKLLS